ncbi:unnamed protein product [Prorocentrum cordatum]|uniref:Uncharacterized protein n=1 Tax=Prorocentrum cordatum TaxID=2364126 RepID=A0ABN9WLM2_9DINO|nr:unnamed protein product [Polarella glacialis]
MATAGASPSLGAARGAGAAPGGFGAAAAPRPATQAAAQGGGLLAAAEERRAALRGVAALFQQPEALGVSSASLLPLYGFDLRGAEFEPAVLRRPRPAVGGHGHRSNPFDEAPSG